MDSVSDRPLTDQPLRGKPRRNGRACGRQYLCWEALQLLHTSAVKCNVAWRLLGDGHTNGRAIMGWQMLVAFACGVIKLGVGAIEKIRKYGNARP